MPGNPGMAPKGAKLFDWCMHKFNDVITRQYLSRPEFYDDATLLIEFSRGGANGFGRALGMLAPAMCWRRRPSSTSRCRARNRGGATSPRYQEKLKHSILAHMVPRETYDYFYDTNDWDELTGGRPSGWLDINGVQRARSSR